MVSPGRSADKPPEGQVAFFSPYLWIAVLFLVLGPVSGVNSNPTLVKGMVGGSVTLPLNISTFSEIEHVTWNGPQKALVLVPSTGNAIFMDKLNQDRLSVNNQNYSLSIYKLTQKDVGTYKAQINRKTSEITAEEEFTLLIYERLQKPQVTVKSVAISKDASCTVTLLCSVEGTDVSYSWIPRVSNVSESYGNSTVTLSWTPCDPDQHYTCKARNLVSQVNSSSIFIQHVCSDPDTSEGRPVAGLLGESVTLPLALPAHQGIKGVIWVFNTSIINKVPAPVTASPLKSSQDFSLKIDSVTMKDAGTYQAFLCSKASKVIHSERITLHVYPAPKKERNIVIGVSVFFTLCFAGIAVWYIWKKKRCGSAPTTNFSQEKSPDVTQDSTMGFSRCRLSRGYDMLGMTPRTAGKQPPSDCSSSDSNLTTEEDEERKVMHMAGPGRDQAHGQVTQGKPKQESKLTTPGSMTPLFEVKGDTVYTQVFFNSQGKTPLSQENENSATIYSSVQGLQEVGPPVRQHGAKSPDISNYENLT
ncbi:T-lymphocyte surface antigen Ly-9 isoform X2 [Erinaceus europaeus]|uniref:T-lymphocyte surface antigen Ly-9 isoform X2 n=1 Tax=Erinaceus europaeus TaxID=9365 RepID=A0ABM3XXV4_ERIEU|nr:T-lymphocyte surface antigen Ly-9 isoform X2 [Erinaceus europaeus]